VVATWNERGIETDSDYGINDGTGSTNFYFHVYPTKVTTAVPDPSGAHGSSTAFYSITFTTAELAWLNLAPMLIIRPRPSVTPTTPTRWTRYCGRVR
jgi:hypothetical protein